MKHLIFMSLCMFSLGCSITACSAADEWASDAVSANKSWAEYAFSDNASTPPFSFVYDGQSSLVTIHNWKKQVSEKKISKSVILRTVTYTAPDDLLEVKAEAKIYTDTPGVEWIIYFTNKGKQDTGIIEKVNAVDERIGRSGKMTPIVHRMKGNVTGAQHSFDDFLAYDVKLTPSSRQEFGTPLALSSNEESPFFNVQWDGGGVITAVGWTGHWGASVESMKDGSINLEAGMRDIRMKLHPGEIIRTPRILQVWWKENDHIKSYNLFRRAMFNHIMPRIDGKLVVPPISHATNCFYSQNSGTEKEILEYLDSIKGLGFECLWLDAFYMKDGWPNGVGNYHMPLDSLADPVRYPRGLKPISDAAHKEKMIFLLWTAPERAVKGTWLYENHSEWLLGTPDQEVKLYDMGNPAAREYMTKYLIELIKGYKIDCIRFDCGALIGELHMKDALEPDRAGMAEIRYHEGLYQMWEDIMKACPGVFIDNCCGGGNRIDLETCARSLPLWRTDASGYTLAVWNPRDLNATAIQNQLITGCLSRYVPFSLGGTMGADPYMMRSAFNAGMTFTEDTRPADYPKAQLKKGIAEGKRIRKYYFGDFYPLSKVNADPKAWCVFQYDRPDKQDGMILAFRRHQAPESNFVCHPYNIDATADYQVTYSYLYKSEKPVIIKGSELANMMLRINDMPGSVLIEYKMQ